MSLDGELDRARKLIKSLREECRRLGYEWRLVEDKLSEHNWGQDGGNDLITSLAEVICGVAEKRVRDDMALVIDLCVNYTVRQRAVDRLVASHREADLRILFEDRSLSEDLRIRALEGITDQQYLKTVALSDDRHGLHIAYVALSHITDQATRDEIAQETENHPAVARRARRP